MKPRISDQVYINTEQVRHKKEAEFVAKQKVQRIREHLQGVKRIRGEAEYHRLRNAVLIEFDKQRGKK